MPAAKKKASGKKIKDLSSSELRKMREKVRKASKLGMNTVHVMLSDKSATATNKKLDTYIKSRTKH